jgi:myo-inositol 2-dehydrogenase/D-chiro-inositol 1-dehydrogenase
MTTVPWLSGWSDPDLRETYGHTPLQKMFAGRDVYGIGFERRRAGRPAVRLGVIGAGGVLQSKWLPALRRLQVLWDPVDFVAVAEPDAAQGEKISKLYACRWYADHRELLSCEVVDAVLVTSPNHLHARHAIDALTAGAAVLVEKPFCTRLTDAGQMCSIASECGGALMPVANWRFSPPVRRARQLVADGKGFRPPLMFIGKMHLGYDYVDLLEDATVHLFDLVRFFLGDVIRVEARGIRRQNGGGRRSYPFQQATVTLECASGSIAQLSTSSAALSLKPWLRVEVCGDRVWLAVDDLFELSLYDSETGPAKSWRPVLANTLLFDEEWGGYMGELEHFLQVVRGQEAPVVNGRDGYGSVELVIASHLSAGRAAPVELPLDPVSADAELAALREKWR